MIVSLSIRDFLLVDRLDLEPGPGFTALTGETGAGKSIILDALAMALGGVAERRMIRPGADMSSVVVEFSLPPDHAVWGLLGDAGVSVSESETLTLKRIVKTSGPSRALLNDQPVSAGLLASVGASLVEIHGQHASAALWRVSAHRDLLDQYAGNEGLLKETAKAWDALKAARERHACLASESAGLDAMRETLQADIARLQELAPMAGEADRLAEERSRLMQAERVGEALSLARAALEDGDMVARLGQAAREIDRVARLPGFDEPGSPARLAADALERTLIEVQESETAIEALAACAEHDPERLETVESRLFALRAAARRHGVDVEALPETLADFQAQLETLGADGEAVEAAARAEREAAAAYHGAAGRLTAARKAAGERLSGAIGDELKPLKLEKVALRFFVTALADADKGASGADRVVIEVQTNPGAPFGALQDVASGGELTRIALALRCALAEGGGAGALVFDEADQGVGGAVAAAMGERLARLAATGRQVFAVTHSPQVAAAASDQWRISKQAGGAEGLGRTVVTGLDDSDRMEEIARMLSGREITREARAAAARLMEERCPRKSPSRC